MGLEEVKEEIIRNAKEQEAALIAEARREAGRITKEAEKKIKEMEERSEADTKKMIESAKKQEISSAEMEYKKMLLDAKKNMIDAVFADAKKRLENLDDKKREAYIKKLLEKAKNDIEAAYVYCNKKDVRFVREFKALPVDITGGLIAENQEKTVRVDYSFETVLQSIKDNELQNINKLLFG
ncbi:hypothetical protein HYW20_00395 [Candidatus Woesearchaeota archaeon]|nr:hypothetical protein [Candidatus Woesearchaeota archaeon]